MHMFILPLSLIFLQEAAFGLHVQEGCISKPAKVAMLRGTEITATVWIPQTNEDEVLVSLTCAEDQIYFVRRIEIKKGLVNVKEMRGGIDRYDTFDIPEGVLRLGWMDFTLALSSSFRVMIGNTTIADIEEVLTSSVTIQGSNVTVGCSEPLIAWEVAEEREAVIPVAGLVPHKVSLFSRSASLPVLALGPNTLRLSWDPITQSITTLASDPRPLPAFLLHNLTVDCHPWGALTKCDILLNLRQVNTLRLNLVHTNPPSTLKTGPNASLAGSALLPDDFTSFSFRANNKDNFVVILQYSRQDEVEEKVCPATKDLVTNPANAESHGWKAAAIACASFNVVLLTAVIVLTVILIKNRADEQNRMKSLKLLDNP
ncbi:uncharacterized protein LOC125039251 isoform X2 [Penaeus chinensis]|uniref:uncharacterized protein LOC125039251 isoform X2 n=1 Tax=Penaeus chinensis TaxID=139456 RepID=UPI001FB63C96|nr:uncharacterized protein LOC125039251 isoform X2 [Penaeus chinensis]